MAGGRFLLKTGYSTGASPAMPVYPWSVGFYYKINLIYNTRDGSLCQMYFLTIPKLEPVSRLTCRMEPPACRSAANASAF